MSFDEWYAQARVITAEAGWIAGVESQQSKIEALKQQIADLEELLYGEQK